MVKHIILWKLKDEFNNNEVKKGIKDGLEGLLGKISGLLEIKVYTEKLPSSNADVMLYSVFEMKHHLKAIQQTKSMFMSPIILYALTQKAVLALIARINFLCLA